MSKSVYSLVLTDEVVAQIDRAAYANNTSRSNLVNQILAEYVSYVTPERRMREIFSAAERDLAASGAFRFAEQTADAVFQLRSALVYKYNPTVQYSVELYRDALPVLGELRVTIRSKSGPLLNELYNFFRYWALLENRLTGQTDSTFTDARFTRKLILQTDGDTRSGTVGAVIAAYISLLDGAMKLWFALADDRAEADRRIQSNYRDYLARNGIRV